jgi:ankyrin repeat protein
LINQVITGARRSQSGKRTIVAAIFSGLVATCGFAQAADFFQLVETGTPESVQAAINGGADVNAIGKGNRTPLMAAALKNASPGVVSVLLAAGADLAAKDNIGMTPLKLAAMGNKNP